jgi:hypothetical protein
VSAEVKEVRRTKRVRRDYQSELKELKMYCQACIKSFERLAESVKTVPPDVVEAYLSAYRDVLSKLGGGK